LEALPNSFSKKTSFFTFETTTRMPTPRYAPNLVFCLLTLLSYTPYACAQNERWKARDAWQDVPGILEAMGVQEGSHVADVGARDGYLTVRLAAAVGPTGHVYAVDIDADALEKLQKNLAAEDTSRVTRIHSMPDDPMLPAERLDAAVVVNAYHEFKAYTAMLRHLKSALKPGGRLVLVEPLSSRRRDATRAEQADHHEIALAYARADLEAVGFEIVEARDPFVERRRQNDEMWLLVGRRP
jgi:precorrin-6B methylase 2